MIYRKKSEFQHSEFLILQKTIYGELRKSPVSKFYKNSVDRMDFMSIRSGQTWGSFKTFQPNFSLCLTGDFMSLKCRV